MFRIGAMVTTLGIKNELLKIQDGRRPPAEMSITWKLLDRNGPSLAGLILLRLATGKYCKHFEL